MTVYFDIMLITKIAFVLNIASGFFLVIVVPFLHRWQFEVLGRVFKLGMWCGGIGLLIQAERNWLYISGIDMMSFESPLWMTKDAGYWFQALGLFCLLYSTVLKRKQGKAGNQETG